MNNQPVMMSNRQHFADLIQQAHVTSGYSLREIEDMTGISFGHVSLILNGKRRASRDTLIVLCTCGWSLPIQEVNIILCSAGYKPLLPLQ